jgi:hypothetical protein
MSPTQEQQPGQDDGIPRQGFWASMPKRSVPRVLLLLAALAGVIYLRQHTGAIAGCMADAFRMPQAQQPGVRVKAPVLLPKPSQKSP